MGLISGMMSGLGEGLQQASVITAKHFLQQQAEEADRQRMERLAEFQQQAQERGFAHAEKQTATQIAATKEEGEAGRGLQRELSGEQRTLTREEGAATRTTQKDIAELHERAATTRHGQTVGLQQQQLEEAKKTGELDRTIKQIAIDNQRRVETLRTEFGKPDTTADRKRAITEEISILTGKDTDKYLPVPLKDDMGNVTGYKIFDTKRGEWIEPKASSPTVGKEVSGFRFKGGNPNDRTNWEPVAKEAVLGGEGGFRSAKTKIDVTKPAAAAEKLYRDPLTSERITKKQWRNKFGEDPTEG